MFCYQNLTLRGHEGFKLSGWSKEDEEKFCELFPTSAISRIINQRIKVVLESDMSRMGALTDLDVDFSKAPAVVIDTLEEGPVIAISLTGCAESVKEARQHTDSQRVIDTVLEAIIVHEAVHVEQVRSGRLMETGDAVIWEGEVWDSQRQNDVGYLDLPWEREAFDAQFSFMCYGQPHAIAAMWEAYRAQYRAMEIMRDVGL